MELKGCLENTPTFLIPEMRKRSYNLSLLNKHSRTASPQVDKVLQSKQRHLDKIRVLNNALEDEYAAIEEKCKSFNKKESWLLTLTTNMVEKSERMKDTLDNLDDEREQNFDHCEESLQVINQNAASMIDSLIENGIVKSSEEIERELAILQEKALNHDEINVNCHFLNLSALQSMNADFDTLTTETEKMCATLKLCEEQLRHINNELQKFEDSP